jgi:5-methylcytosine-specific restriction endonuclease McrA
VHERVQGVGARAYGPGMLREVKDAGFGRRLTLFGWRYFPVCGQTVGAGTWGTRRFRALQERQVREPVVVLEAERRAYWLFEDRCYWEDEGLAAADVLALVRERERRQQRRLERAHAALAGANGAARRESIPRTLRLAVWERDGGACAQCGARFDIQYDHVIPVALGGATSVENLQILCGECNRAKGASLG